MKESGYAQDVCHFTDIILHVITYGLFTTIKSLHWRMELYR